MREVFLWLEGLSFEEEALLSVACIYAIGLLMVPVVWIDNHIRKGE